MIFLIKIRLSVKLTYPRIYRFDFLVFTYEIQREEKRKFKLKGVFSLFSRIRDLTKSIRYLIKRSIIEKDPPEGYDICLSFYLYQLCIAGLLVLRNKIFRGIRRIGNG